MSTERFVVKLFLPSQAATETEATIVRWHVKAGDSFVKGQVLADAESAKSTFAFESPCSGSVRALLHNAGATLLLEEPVIEIETGDPAMKGGLRASAAAKTESDSMVKPSEVDVRLSAPIQGEIGILGVGAYVPERVVANSELLRDFPDMTDDYLVGVTGIRQRYWATDDEKPSDMAYKASISALRKSNLTAKDIGAIVVATTTPDVVMPSTACMLQGKLEAYGVPAFDINAACSGWLYGISVAKGMVMSGLADNVLVVGVDLQSRLLDRTDKGTYFLFGDGAGATIVSGSIPGHVIKRDLLIADARGLHMARRSFPGYHTDTSNSDPYVRVDGHALFRFATSSFCDVILDVIARSNWKPQDVRWIVPHQANSRILRAVAKKSEIAFERVYLNIDKVGNTSSASIPNALVDIDRGLQKGDKVILCSVGAGITAAAMSIEW